MMRTLVSFCIGLFVLATWGAVIIFTSQDFPNEGPHSFWFKPFELWANFVQGSGLSEELLSLGPIVGLAAWYVVLFGPFLLLFSVLSFFVIRLLPSPRRTR